MKEFKYVVTDPEGIHARPAGILVKPKRIFGVMGLGVKTGEEVTITVEGADEDTAVAELEAFFKENL